MPRRIKPQEWDKQWQEFVKAAGQAAELVTKRMVTSGGYAAAKVLKETDAWGDDSGELRRAISPTIPKKSTKGEGIYVEVYPQGDNTDGQRLETIGFVLEHGRTGRVLAKRGKKRGQKVVILPMAPHPWMDQGMDDAADDISAAMHKEWDQMAAALNKIRR